MTDLRDMPSITLDGHPVVLSANIERCSDISAVLSNGADGIGLFRTEYLFINRDVLPSEEEQYEAYKRVAAALKPNPVIIRTLDLGGDKFITNMPLPPEMNPFLGWRAIRFCLHEKGIFRQQLRAILRAAVEGNIKIMFPMICRLAELTETLELMEECKNELKAQNIPYRADIEVGVMIEIPSAVMIADSLAKRVQFFSLGTNDLIQYSLAVDRLNERIAHLYEPTHPGVLRLIQLTVEAAHRNGIWVGVCGEMGSDPKLIPLLIGLGVDEISAASPLVPHIKFLVRRLKLTEANELAQKALSFESGAETMIECEKLLRQVAPSLADPSV